MLLWKLWSGVHECGMGVIAGLKKKEKANLIYVSITIYTNKQNNIQKWAKMYYKIYTDKQNNIQVNLIY